MLYKYLPSDRVDVLESLKIRCSPLKALNDPFEIFLPIGVESEINECLRDSFDKIDAYLTGFPRTEETELKRLSLRAAAEEGVRSQLNSSIAGDNLVESLGNSFGILSLSRAKNSLLMWSHYASQHSGYVIGFDETKIFPDQYDHSGEKIVPSKVIYSKDIRHVEFTGNNWQELLVQKPIEWEYEQEERLFVNMDLSMSVGLDGFSTEIILTSLDPSSILEIFIGCRSSKETRNRIIASVKLHSLDCEIYDCFLSKEKYEIGFTRSTDIEHPRTKNS
jgi:Protein of unknown function (DUF2971)